MKILVGSFAEGECWKRFTGKRSGCLARAVHGEKECKAVGIEGEERGGKAVMNVGKIRSANSGVTHQSYEQGR